MPEKICQKSYHLRRLSESVFCHSRPSLDVLISKSLAKKGSPRAFLENERNFDEAKKLKVKIFISRIRQRNPSAHARQKVNI
jgi:hypothetical protein